MIALEPSVEELERMLAAVGQRIISHLATLAEQPASDLQTLAPEAVADPPQWGRPLEETLDTLFRRVIPPGVNSAGPGYLGFVPGGGVFSAALGDFIVKTVNRFVGLRFMAPGLVRIEWSVIRWLCQIVGFPRESGGILTSGGSLASFVAVYTARHNRLPADFLNSIIYVSDQAHVSARKAAQLAGFPAANVRTVASDAWFRLDLSALEAAVLDDKAHGLRPFMIVASAGTTNTGANDDLTAIADFAAHHGLWLHVDAAYGGFFVITPEGRSLICSLERADSIVLDPHKGLGLPYGTGCLLVKDLNTLYRAHSMGAEYLPVNTERHELPDFYEISPELSREARGLRLWLPLQLHGIQPFVVMRSTSTQRLVIYDKKLPSYSIRHSPNYLPIGSSHSPVERMKILPAGGGPRRAQPRCFLQTSTKSRRFSAPNARNGPVPGSMAACFCSSRCPITAAFATA